MFHFTPTLTIARNTRCLTDEYALCFALCIRVDSLYSTFFNPLFLVYGFVEKVICQNSLNSLLNALHGRFTPLDGAYSCSIVELGPGGQLCATITADDADVTPLFSRVTFTLLGGSGFFR